ncbi:MAG: glycosyltransferase family 4 protein [Saprospiraceae bacterium]|nr:glycosyltransferase family 4 protein [Saprospiraceae bacterium]
MIQEYAKQYPEDQLYLLKPDRKKSSYENYFTEPNIFTSNYPNFLGIPRFFSLLKKVPNDGIFHGLSAEIPILKKPVKKVIVTIHDLIFLARPQDYKFIDRKIYEAKLLHAVKHSDVILSISQFTANALKEYVDFDSSKLKVHFQNCNSIFYKSLSEEERNIVLYKYNVSSPYWICVSSFNGRKNIRSIIEAYSLIPESDRIPILLIGSGSLQQECKQLTEKLRLTNHIRFLDHIHPIDLPALYQSSIGLIYPSVLEGFGIPALEAMASGIPLIGHKGSSVEEAAGKAGVFVDCLSPEQLSHSIISLQSDQQLRQEILSHTQSQLSKYSNEKLMAQLREIYSS